MSQFSLALKSSQALQPPSPSGGARIALSPDGRALAYIGPAERGTALWLRRLDQLDATPIAGTEGASEPFFSPDGQRVGFVKNGTEVRIASLAGAPTVTLTDKANTTSGDWGDDGYIYFEVDSGVARMRATGGDTEPVYKINTEAEGDRHRVGARPARRDRRAVPAAPRRAGTRRLRDHGDAAAARHPRTRSSAACSPPTPTGLPAGGDRGRQAHRHPVRPEEARDRPARRSRCSRGSGSGTTASTSTSRSHGTARVAYTTGGTQATRRAAWVSREGGVTPVDSTWDPQGIIGSAALSPDGKAIAVGAHPGRPAGHLGQAAARRARSRGSPSPTPRAGGRPGRADGKDVYYIADRSGSRRRADLRPPLRRDRHASPAVPHRRGHRPGPRHEGRALAPAPDGARAARHGRHPGAPPRRLGARAAGRDAGDGAVPGALAGRPLAGVQLRRVRRVRRSTCGPFPETAGAKWQVSTAGGSQPSWSSTGRELLYVNGKNEMVSAEIPPGTTFSVGAQRTLFSVQPFAAVGAVPAYWLTADDKRFLVLREGEAGQPGELVVAENWVQQLAAAGAK